MQTTFNAPSGVTSITLSDGSKAIVVNGQITVDTKFTAELEAAGFVSTAFTQNKGNNPIAQWAQDRSGLIHPDTGNPVSLGGNAQSPAKANTKIRRALSKIWGNQAQVAYNAGVTAGVAQNQGWVGKRELEVDAPAAGTYKTVKIRLWILSHENVNKSEGWQVAIAPTETADISTTNNAHNPIVGGRTIQYYASGSANSGNTNDQFGYVRGTFGNQNKSGKLLPGGAETQYSIGSVSGSPAVGQGASAGTIYSTAFGAICTDWMTVPLVPRTDTSPNGRTKAIIQYRISRDGIGADSISQIGRTVNGNFNGYSQMGAEYWKWLNGDTSSRFDYCAATTAALYDVTNTLTNAPTLVSLLDSTGQGVQPYMMWEVDYSSTENKVFTVCGDGDSMTESSFSTVVFNGYVSNGTSGVAGNILTVTGYAANSGGGDITSGMRVYHASLPFPTVIDVQLTGTTGKAGTYSLKLSSTPPYSGGSVSVAVGTSGSPASFTGNSNDGIKGPISWWKSAAKELSTGNVVVDTVNLGHSTHRVESFVASLYNMLQLGCLPNIVLFPTSSVNNFNPTAQVRGIDAQLLIQTQLDVLDVCRKLGIVVVFWSVPNFNQEIAGTYEEKLVLDKVNQHASDLAAQGYCYYCDLKTAFGSQATVNSTYLVDGTHWNEKGQLLAKATFQPILSTIIANS